MPDARSPTPFARAAAGVLAGLAERWSRWLYRRGYLRVDYPPSAANVPRYGHGRPQHPELERLLAEHRDAYRHELRAVAAYGDALVAIDRVASEPGAPAWVNDWLPGLDAASLYALTRRHAPARYVEIGSGTSTSFVARARRDGGLETRVTSIDPNPRAEVDALCDEVIRRPLELTDLSMFADLRAGDIVFLDGSHRVFMNSDVTVFFLEVLPRLPPGVLVGVHDVYLPDDYPPEIRQRLYSEQYLLAAALLAPSSGVVPVLPCHYVSCEPALANVLAPLWAEPRLAGVPTHGVAFWLRTSR